MYDQSVTDAKIDKYLYKTKVKFEPVWHTRAQCEQAVEHFDSIVDLDHDTGRLIAKRDNPYLDHPERKFDKRWEDTLTPDEEKFIRNERLLCKYDFWYFLNYVWIKNEEDEEFRFIPWSSQSIFMKIVGEMEKMGISIFLIILKARQLGISRIVSLILLHRVIFWININAFMASAVESSTNLLFDMSDFVLKRLPFWLIPVENFRREGKLLELANGSRITLQHGQQMYGMGRGTSVTVAHLSEVSEYDEGRVGDLIDSSLLRAMHPSPKSFLALESTAKGINNYWWRAWGEAKALWPLRRTRFRPLFLPWFVGGLYPKPNDLVGRPIPSDYAENMKPWAKNHADMAREYVLKTDYLVNELGSNWHMPLEQIWYYECERDAALRKNILTQFLQEMPANDDEAFQSSSNSVFDVPTITFYRDHAHAAPIEGGVYGLVGPQDYLNPRLQPSTLLYDHNGSPVDIVCDPKGGLPLVNFTLQPLRFDGWSLESNSGDTSIDKIYIWEPPMDGHVYGLGVDTSDGVEKDSTVIEVVRKASLWGPTKQVAEFASSKMNAIDSVPFIWALGTYYSTWNIERTHIQQPRLAIECRGHGDMAQNIVRMLGWSNFHPWNDKNIDSRKQKLSDYTKIGVFTNSWFRAAMIEMLVKMLRDGEIEICSPALVREMASLSGDEESQSLRAAYGGHDDRIMALGFILASFYKFDIDYWRGTKIRAYQGKSPQPNKRPRQVAKWPGHLATRTGIVPGVNFMNR